MKRLFMLLLVLAAYLLLPFGPAAAVTHMVVPGESLFLIARAYGVDVEELKRVNGLQGDLIYPGQQLYVPLPTSFYVVQPGDTLYLIGQRFGVGYQSIMVANGLTNSLIYPGQRLLIPAPGGGGGWAVSRGGVYSGPINYTRADFDLLARLITAEADSCSYLTKVAVGAVVVNRVKSPLFPSTIPGVIYQVDETGSYQFEPVLNGWINRPASEEAKRAALEALNGADPTNGALYFFESWVPNSWLQSRPVSRILDAFTFTY